MTKQDAKSLLRTLKIHRDTNKRVIDELMVLEEVKKPPRASHLIMLADAQWDIARILQHLINILSHD